MPILILFLNVIYGQATIIAPAAATLSVTSYVCEDTAMDDYLAEEGK